MPSLRADALQLAAVGGVEVAILWRAQRHLLARDLDLALRSAFPAS